MTVEISAQAVKELRDKLEGQPDHAEVKMFVSDFVTIRNIIVQVDKEKIND